MAFFGIKGGGGSGGSDAKIIEGTFVSSPYQYGIVDVVCGFQPDLIMVILPFSNGDTVSYWWNKLSYAATKAVWALAPAEAINYAVNLGRASGETGIQQINADGFSFMSNGGNTRNINCKYIAIKFGSPQVTYKNYIKFNNYGFYLPFTIDSDYKVTVEFNDTVYVNDNRILDNDNSSNYLRLVTFSNQYWSSSGSSQSGWGSWSAGAHTFVCNNGNGKNELDGVEVQNYTPTTVNAKIGLGASYSQPGGIAPTTYVSRFKIESISTGDVICDLKPALINDVLPAMYDSVNDNYYAPGGAEVFDNIS